MKFLLNDRLVDLKIFSNDGHDSKAESFKP